MGGDVYSRVLLAYNASVDHSLWDASSPDFLQCRCPPRSIPDVPVENGAVSMTVPHRWKPPVKSTGSPLVTNLDVVCHDHGAERHSIPT